MKWMIAVFIAFVIGIADIAFLGHTFHVFGVQANDIDDKHLPPYLVSERIKQGNQLEAATVVKTIDTVSKNGADMRLEIAAESQQPELYNGCEVTSLSMLLNAVGHPVDKITLAEQIAKDPTPMVTDDVGNVESWGDPENGFVGDITGKNQGYGVYHKPVAQLLNQILPGETLDLTGNSFVQVLQQVAQGKPVIAWTTVDFSPTSTWITWQGPNGPVQATFDEHVVLIVGCNQTQVFVNDPLDGSAAKAINRELFEESWNQFGKQAVTVKQK